jgi:hypothetical protein
MRGIGNQMACNQLVNSKAWSVVVILTKSTMTNKELRHRMCRAIYFVWQYKPSLIWMVGVKHRVQYFCTGRANADLEIRSTFMKRIETERGLLLFLFKHARHDIFGWLHYHTG